MRRQRSAYARWVVPDPDDAAETSAHSERLDNRRRQVLVVSRSLSIPIRELSWRTSTSGGPGGQHANRTSSRVEVAFDVTGSQALGPRQRARLLERCGPVVRAASSDSRSQARNRQIALERLGQRLASALRADPPRRPTAPTKGSRERRLEEKRHRSELKRHRHGERHLDD